VSAPVDVRAFRVSFGLDPDGGLLLNQREAARVLGRSPKTLRRWTQKGVIPCFREEPGAWPVYSVPALVRWMEEQQGAAA
jgi:hypothetical protein